MIVTNNSSAHTMVEELARERLAADGILNGNRLVILRLGPYSPMLNPIEGCWSVLKAGMRAFMMERKNECLVRREFEIYTAYHLELMKEVVETSKHIWLCVQPG